MPKIQVLDKQVAELIAAGEVVGRPASVVKELMENSVDAGSRTITVNYKDGGRSLIQVVDDGCGMSETDARLAFERHATSKIRRAEDLYQLASFGFRGEALPSVASVAEVELRTRTADQEIGTHIFGPTKDWECHCGTDAAAFGEFKAGAGRGSEHMIAITLGTGLGSGIIIHSKLYTGFAYGGAEFGHSLLVKDGELCTCGRRGCLEAYASATGLIRMTKRHMESNRDSMMWKLVDGDLNRVSGRTAFDAMRQGDAEGSRVVEIYTEYLAEGIVNIVNIFQPEIICIGGGLSKEGDTLLKPINRYIEQYAFSRFADKNTVVRIAELGNDAGLIGAAFLKDAFHCR